MQAKETVQTRWNRLRRQRGTGEKVSVDATALMRFADTAIHFLLAAVLAGASVFGDYAPFGVALVGAAGSGAVSYTHLDVYKRQGLQRFLF